MLYLSSTSYKVFGFSLFYDANIYKPYLFFKKQEELIAWFLDLFVKDAICTQILLFRNSFI